MSITDFHKLGSFALIGTDIQWRIYNKKYSASLFDDEEKAY